MILYKDENFIICQKPIGISSQKTSDSKNMISAISELTDIPEDSIYPIHRLDTIVGGTILYALNPKSSALLTRMMSEKSIKKQYLAVVHGRPAEDKGIFTDLLFKDSSKNKSFVVKRPRKGVKDATLEYALLGFVNYNKEVVSLVKITLKTGRSHQVRVQFSSRKMPLFGDRRYGSGKDKCTVSLWSHSLSFISPFDQKQKNYKSLPNIDAFPWNLFPKNLYEN